MFLGCDPFGLVPFDSSIAIESIKRIEAMNCKIDQLQIDEDINILYKSDKGEWDYNTVFQAKFQDNLEAGNITNKGMPIEYIQFRKREIDTLEWREIATFNYDVLVTLYQYMDRYVQSTEEYEYAVVPITANIIGQATTNKILCDFDGIWLVGKDNQFKLQYDISQGEYDNVNQNTIIETLGSEYPIVYNSQVDYLKTTCNAKIISDEQINSNSGKIEDKRHERIVRENIIKFLKDRKPKIYKTGSGKLLLVSLLNIKEKPINDVGGVIADISCDIVEIGNPKKQSDLERSGLVNVQQRV